MNNVEELKLRAEAANITSERQAGDCGQANAVTREKYWTELSIEEKIERTREMLKRGQAELQEHYSMLVHAIEENQRLSQRFLVHRHLAPDGGAMLPAKDEQQFMTGILGRGYTGLDRAHKPADPNKTYF